jgi:hypothetical protein
MRGVSHSATTGNLTTSLFWIGSTYFRCAIIYFLLEKISLKGIVHFKCYKVLVSFAVLSSFALIDRINRYIGRFPISSSSHTLSARPILDAAVGQGGDLANFLVAITANVCRLPTPVEDQGQPTEGPKEDDQQNDGQPRNGTGESLRGGRHESGVTVRTLGNDGGPARRKRQVWSTGRYRRWWGGGCGGGVVLPWSQAGFGVFRDHVHCHDHITIWITTCHVLVFATKQTHRVVSQSEDWTDWLVT